MKFKTLSKLLAIGAALFVSSWGVASASTVPFSTGYVHPLGSASYDPSTYQFSDTYTFSSTRSGAAKVYWDFTKPKFGGAAYDSLSFLISGPGISSPIGVSNALTSTFNPFFLPMVGGDVYTLTVAGKLNSAFVNAPTNGDPQYLVAVSAVPLPAAALLFGSLLVGGAALGRNKKKDSENASAAVAA